MKAEITIKGNQVKQYTLTLIVPSEWLAKFTLHDAISVGGERLDSTWGDSYNGGKGRIRSWTRNTWSEVELIGCILREELHKARDFLTTIVETEKTYEIEL